jgi:hypothetical protein
MELLVRRAYRPALRRVTIFRIRNVDSARIKRLRERLSIKIQDIGKSISEKTGDFDQKNYPEGLLKNKRRDQLRIPYEESFFLCAERKTDEG